jgi:hypothetical protein
MEWPTSASISSRRSASSPRHCLMGWANYSVLQVKNQIDQRHQEVQETLNQREIALNMLVAELHVRNSDEDEQNFW